MLVEDYGPDVLGKVFDVIAPHGCCSGYEANYDMIQEVPVKSLSQKYRHDVFI
jgi:hypothetical protein